MKTNLLRRMMAVMAAFLVTMFTLPMMAGNKVEINGVSKQLYGHVVNEVNGYDNAFSIVIYLSRDKKERLMIMGDNDRHATGKYVSIKSHQSVVEDQCPWVVRYVRDDRFAVQTVGYASYETALFESGSFCVIGNPRGGRFGLTLHGKITDNVKGDGNAYTFDVDFRTEWTAPTAGTFSIGQVTDSSIALTWTRGTDNDTPQEQLRYQVEYKPKDDYGWELIDVADANSYLIEGLKPGTPYQVDILVRDACGNYKRYGEVEVTTRAAQIVASVKINGESKPLYNPQVVSVYGDDNAFSISYYLSKDKKERLDILGNNALHASGEMTYLNRYEPVHEGQTSWIIRYVKDGHLVVHSSGEESFGSALFKTGILVAYGGDSRSGRYGLQFWGTITDDKNGDGNTYEFDVTFRTEGTKPKLGNVTLGEVTDNSIALSWTHGKDNDTPQEGLQYTVEYQKKGDSGWYMHKVGNSTSYVIKEDVEPNTTYLVRLLVMDACGNYTRSEAREVTTKKEDFGLMIAGTEVTRDNCDDLSSINGVEGKVSFDPETYTLYLDGATIDGGTTNAIFMSEDKELTINVSNDVTLTNDDAAVLMLKGNATINGEGTLNVASRGDRCGIYMFKDLVIDRCTVIASGSWGIAGEDGSVERLIVRAATVKATGGDYTPIADLKSLSLLGCRIVTPEGGVYNTTNHYVALDGAPWLGTVVISPVVQQSDLVLLKQSDDGNNKAPIVKIIRELTGLGLLECSQLYDNAPSVIAENLTLLVADEAAEKLRALGAEVEVRPHGNPDGIEEILAAPGQKLKGIYTLTGNRLDTPFEKLPSGIYIVNGKKVTKK